VGKFKGDLLTRWFIITYDTTKQSIAQSTGGGRRCTDGQHRQEVWQGGSSQPSARRSAVAPQGVSPPVRVCVPPPGVSKESSSTRW
jgi:hypothetical protein